MATLCAAVIAVTKPAAAVTGILDSDIASSPRAGFCRGQNSIAQLKRSRVSNALPFSGVGAAKLALRFYTMSLRRPHPLQRHVRQRLPARAAS